MRLTVWIILLSIAGFYFVTQEGVRASEETLQEVREHVAQGEFAAAFETWKASKLAEELARADLGELEELALAQVRPIPAANYVANRNGYRLLAEINENSDLYERKLRLYSDRLSRGACKAVVAFNFPDVDPSKMDVSDASQFANPRELPSPLLVEYTRANDGTRWRYLCSFQEQEITFSVLSDGGQPGRMWMDPTSDHREFTYTLNGMAIEITETWPDGSKIVKTLDLQ